MSKSFRGVGAVPSFTFLGSGSSTGVPVIGCHCTTCTSPSTYNKRLRPAGVISCEGKKILIDAGPDVREQVLREKIDKIDGLILTHAHYDHIGGLDELRAFFFKSKVPVPSLVSPATYAELKKRYDYLFMERPNANTTARFDFEMLEGERGEKLFLGLPISYLTFYQGGMEVKGYRMGNFAYICDIRDYDEAIFKDLEGVDILILSAQGPRPSHVHLSIDEACSFARRVGAKATYLTHLGHEIEFTAVSDSLPKGVFLGFDGLKVDFTMEMSLGS